MCGVVGIAGHEEAANLTYLGLYALQHRGQETAGIVSTDGKRFFKTRRKALVSETFDAESLKSLKGKMAIGHVRYPTSGGNAAKNVQPFMGSGSFGSLAVAHNGNLTNFKELRARFEKKGALFHSSMDTEVILHAVASSNKPTLPEKILEGLAQVEGAYSLLFLHEDMMIAVRDPYGFRPLVLGDLAGAPVVASETCAFDLMGAKTEREIEPGEMWIAYSDGRTESIRFGNRPERQPCVFEHIYFSRPDSEVFGQEVYQVRKRLGHELAREHPVNADIVVPVPDSGVIAAIGFSEERKIPLQMGLIRNHYVGRTFIEPKQSIRGFGVKVKLNPVASVLRGKNIALVDDSIVRGTTSQKIVKMIKEAGAKSVTLLVSSPPIVSPCYYGIDTPTKGELIAANQSLDQIRKFIGADEVRYLSVEGVLRAVHEGRLGPMCTSCFSGRYPTTIKDLDQRGGSGSTHV